MPSKGHYKGDTDVIMDVLYLKFKHRRKFTDTPSLNRKNVCLYHLLLDISEPKVGLFFSSKTCHWQF